MSVPTKVIQGPCLITHNGQTYFSAGDVTVSYAREMVDLSSSQHGRFDSRHRSQKVEISFTPVGQTAVLIALSNALTAKSPGQSVIPGGLSGTTYACTGEADTEVITATGHTFTAGTRVAFSSITGGSGLTTGALYYVISVSGNDFSLSLTEGGSAINFTTDISAGVIAAVVETPLVIRPLTNAGDASSIWTFPRAGLTAIGNFKVSAGAQVAGAITFTALESAVVSGSYFTTAAWSAPASGLIDDFTAASVITPASFLVWAANPASLSSGDYQMTSVDGWDLEFSYQVKEQFRESVGIADFTFVDFNATVSGMLANLADYQNNLVAESSLPGLQPFSTVRPGQTATRKKLSLVAMRNDGTGAGTVVSADLVLCSFAAAEWTSAQMGWGADINRTGQVQFRCIPQFSSGVKSLFTPVWED